MRLSIYVIALIVSFSSKAMDISKDNAEKIKEANIKLLHAACIGDVELAQRALNDGATINVQNTSSNTPLHEATPSGYLDIAELIICKGATINTQTDLATRAPLDQEADLSIDDNEGNTPLHIAAQRDNLDMLEWLIIHGASVRIVNAKNKTALDYIALQKCYNHLSLLKPILSSNTKEAKALLATWNECYGKKELKKEQIDELNRALPLAAALGYDDFVTITVTKFSTYITLQTLENTLVAVAAQGCLSLFKTLCNQLPPHLVTIDQFTAIVEEALYWAALNGHRSIVDFILYHALVLQQAPALNILRAGRYITSLLRTRLDLSTYEHNSFTDIRESLKTVARLRQAAGRQATSRNILSALVTYQTSLGKLPLEIVAIILSFALLLS